MSCRYIFEVIIVGCGNVKLYIWYYWVLRMFHEFAFATIHTCGQVYLSLHVTDSVGVAAGHEVTRALLLVAPCPPFAFRSLLRANDMPLLFLFFLFNFDGQLALFFLHAVRSRHTIQCYTARMV